MRTRVYTYVVQSIHGGPVKIGITTEPTKRLAALQNGNPYELRYVALIKGNREREMHEGLDYARLRGEWFDAEDERVIERIRLIRSIAQAEHDALPAAQRRTVEAAAVAALLKWNRAHPLGWDW